jgi:DNA invertase Pin-like site-specific DNA recombinase
VFVALANDSTRDEPIEAALRNNRDRLFAAKGTHLMRVVALDLPTSRTMATNADDEFTVRMFEAINGMLFDTLAAVARKDYVDRRRRQAQKAKAEGRLPADSPVEQWLAA